VAGSAVPVELIFPDPSVVLFCTRHKQHFYVISVYKNMCIRLILATTNVLSMIRKREFLRAVGATSLPVVAGCTTRPDSDTSTETRRTTGVNPDPTERDEQTTQARATVDPFPLPGNPVTVSQGTLPFLSGSAPRPKTSVSGFNGEDDVKEFKDLASDVSLSVPRGDLTLAGSHYGAGMGSMFGTVTFQTAWRAPKTGSYQIRSSYLRSDYYSYEPPEYGSVGISMDSHLVALRHSDSQTLSRASQPDLRHRRNRVSDELIEMLIETGLTLLLGRVLGLGLIARQILGEIIDRIINIRPSKKSTGITQFNHDHPSELSTTFTAEAGEVYVFEYGATNGYCFQLDEADGPLFPFNETTLRPLSFYIEPA
jgi:hypothetical protein